MAQDFPPNPIGKEGYTLEFNDDFEATSLDTEKWFPYYLPQWSSREKSATNYRMGMRSLILKIDEEQAPWCPEFNGQVKVSSLQTGTFSGELNSIYGQHRVSPDCEVREEQKTEKLYTPKYGYFEIRARALKSNNNVCAFWMIGFEEEPEKSAEICIMEIKGQNIIGDKSINGYGLRAFADTTLDDEFYEESFDIDASQFHTYAAEWKPSAIDFFIDNKKVKSVRQSPAYEMQFMLNIYEVPTDLKLGDLEMSYPKEFEIDYVRAYQPINGY
ncbi:MAG: glycoside hydrolase family 16 protein [Cyclobacteriaceae bacterium]